METDDWTTTNKGMLVMIVGIMLFIIAQIVRYFVNK